MQEEVGASTANWFSSDYGIGGSGGGLTGGDCTTPINSGGAKDAKGGTQTEGGSGAGSASFGKGGEGPTGIFSGGGRRILWRCFWMERSRRWFRIYSRKLPKKMQNSYINTYWKRRM